ncbi:hypothetical protein MSIMFI_04061 [Mycobacterium simulans]|nr:hypothetical protein MSIMFI_04061 [Mycobacterium simulans]
MKVWLLWAASLTAWWKRTGLRRFAAQYSPSSNRDGPSWTVVIIGIFGGCGAKSASAERSCGNIGSMIG